VNRKGVVGVGSVTTICITCFLC